jgi:nucleotidyltransferase/DNA polymerase involved in DNA repair
VEIACLLVPSFALACEIAERPGLRGLPAVVTDDAGLRVVDATPEAARRGVRRGITVREATAFCPALVVIEPRPAHLARMSEALVAATETVTPLVEEVEPGLLFAGIDGLERLFPAPGAIERALLGAVPTRFAPRLGIASARFTAYAAARTTPPGTALTVPATGAAEFLAEHPAAWLPLDGETLEQMRLFGLKTLGAFAALPRHAVEAQFGAAAGRAWLAARGEDPTPLHPRAPARERVVEHVQSQPPLINRESISRTIEQLLGRALRQPRARGRFVRSLRLRATGEDGRLWERTHVLKEPMGDRDRLWTLIASLVENAAFPGPVSELELELGELTAESGRQRGLFVDRQRRRAELDEMVRHLKVRYGHSPIARVVALEPWSRIPERRHALMDYDP